MTGELRNIVVVSDLHCGCRFGLHPDRKLMLHGGKPSEPSPLQSKVWSHWRYFHDVFVPDVTRGEPYAYIVNGDAVEGQPSGAKTPISANTDDQLIIAEACLRPEVERAAVYLHLNGTENHVGKSAENERTVARHLGAVFDDYDQPTRDFLWYNLRGHLIHFAHHVGTTGSQAYEATAPHKEYIEFLTDAARWGRKPPQLLVRSHRHRCIKPIGPSSELGVAGCVVTPGWQLKTPYCGRFLGGRASEPQIGGIVIRVGSRRGLYVADYVYSMERPRVEEF